MRLNLLEQAREWRARGMRDVADLSNAFLRNGAILVVVAIIASITLAANASSAPLGRVWSGRRRPPPGARLRDQPHARRRQRPGTRARTCSSANPDDPRISGSRRPSEVFTATSVTARTPSGAARHTTRSTAAPGQQLDHARQSSLRQQMSSAESAETVGSGGGLGRSDRSSHPGRVRRRRLRRARRARRSSTSRRSVETNGAAGRSSAGKLADGMQPGRSVQSQVASPRRDRPRRALTGNELAASGTNYPEWVDRYSGSGPESVGETTRQTARQIISQLPPEQAGPISRRQGGPGLPVHRRAASSTKPTSAACADDPQLVDCFLGSGAAIASTSPRPWSCSCASWACRRAT